MDINTESIKGAAHEVLKGYLHSLENRASLLEQEHKIKLDMLQMEELNVISVHIAKMDILTSIMSDLRNQLESTPISRGILDNQNEKEMG